MFSRYPSTACSLHQWPSRGQLYGTASAASSPGLLTTTRYTTDVNVPVNLRQTTDAGLGEDEAGERREREKGEDLSSRAPKQELTTEIGRIIRQVWSIRQVEQGSREAK